VWTAGNAAQHAAVTESAKLLWVHVQYVGIAGVPLAVYAFTCQFTGNEHWARGWRLGAVATPLVAIVVLSWTNGAHHLVRTENVQVVERTGVLVDSYQGLDRSGAWGPAFWAAWLYSQGLVVVSTVLLLRGVLYAQDVFQRQTAAITIGALVPWTGQFLYLGGISPFEPEVFFVVAGGAFVYAVLRYEMLDLLPVARDAVIEMLDDGVVVVDPKGRVVDVNDAATGILGEPAATLVGTDAAGAFSAVPQLLVCYENRSGTDDLVIGRGDSQRHYDVQVSSFAGGVGSGRAGTVLVLHDMTALRDRLRPLYRLPGRRRPRLVGSRDRQRERRRPLRD
jgi:PAS domain-containing protein